MILALENRKTKLPFSLNLKEKIKKKVQNRISTGFISTGTYQAVVIISTAGSRQFEQIIFELYFREN